MSVIQYFFDVVIFVLYTISQLNPPFCLVLARSITQNYIPVSHDAWYLTWNNLPPVDMSCDTRCMCHLDTSSHQRMNIHFRYNYYNSSVQFCNKDLIAIII